MTFAIQAGTRPRSQARLLLAAALCCFVPVGYSSAQSLVQRPIVVPLDELGEREVKSQFWQRVLAAVRSRGNITVDLSGQGPTARFLLHRSQSPGSPLTPADFQSDTPFGQLAQSVANQAPNQHSTAVPLAALLLLIPSPKAGEAGTFSLPDPKTAATRGDEVPSGLEVPRSVNRQEVDPAEARGTISSSRWSFSHAARDMSRQDEVKLSDSTTMADRSRQCSSAVRTLRGSNEWRVNMIDDFQSQCLFADSQNQPRSLNEKERRQAAGCLDAYVRYSTTCFGSTVDPELERVARFTTGIVYKARRAQGKWHGEVWCTATIVDDSYILTARHCFSGNSNETSSNTMYGFISGSTSFRIEDLGYYLDTERIGEIDLASARSVSRQRGNDIDAILIKYKPLDREFAYYSPVLERRIPPMPPSDNDARLVLVRGYQRLVMRTYLLKRRLGNELLPTPSQILMEGHWIFAMRTDGTPTCAMLPEQDVTRHTCQTAPATSGAAVFLRDLVAWSDRRRTQVIGVHSAAATVRREFNVMDPLGDR